MSSIEELLTRIEEPMNIREALAASGAYPLKVAFDMDKTVQALVKDKGDVEKAILERFKQRKKKSFDDITEACFCYILEKRNAKSAIKELSEFLADHQAKADPHRLSFAPFFAVNALKVFEKHDDIRADLAYQPKEFEVTLNRVKEGRKK